MLCVCELFNNDEIFSPLDESVITTMTKKAEVKQSALRERKRSSHKVGNPVQGMKPRAMVVKTRLLQYQRTHFSKDKQLQVTMKGYNCHVLLNSGSSTISLVFISTAKK
ncbi:hypothetical protein E2C01_062928 [Portunus trituberculatus]|uniref:Uncharacterized protein n=1 Tax=Portunus trituberculatus TaxID=210409 RepID=A0A5B7HF22_PORTR|nr:hypothetical protein [Portunus trituberculatus]